ncbi:MAG TPA: PmoA family protein [Acidimicrobiales bacterium]
MSEVTATDDGTAITVRYGLTPLLRYVYRPDDPERESRRPYGHPLRTLAGDVVTIYRPHDHVWHKGLALSLPNVGEANFWGGPTWVRDQGYVQRPNNGSMRHDAFDLVAVKDGAALLRERLTWVTQPGEPWFAEQRSLSVSVHAELDAWVLLFDTRFTNLADATVPIGSPTTHGRPNAGYGGLFWRGPRSFTGGVVRIPGATGGDELMGVRAPWLAFTGVHDGHGRSSTLVMVDWPANSGDGRLARGDAGGPRWFVRSTPFAAVCPAPFFDTELPVAPGDTVHLRYAVVVADGDGVRAPQWAELGRSTMDRWTP